MRKILLTFTGNDQNDTALQGVAERGMDFEIAVVDLISWCYIEAL